MVSVIPAMVHQFEALVQDFPGYLASLQDRSARFRGLSDRFHLTGRIQDLLADLPGQLGGGLLGFTSRLFGALFSTLTVVVLTIYFMADLPRLRHGVMRVFPRAHRAKFGRIADVMVDKVGAYMIGNLLISLAAGVAAFAVFTALGVPFAVPLALAVALCDLIPMIGATLGAVIGVLATLLTTELWPTTVIVAIFFVAYQQLENYLIAPRILRHTVSLERGRGAAGRADRRHRPGPGRRPDGHPGRRRASRSCWPSSCTPATPPTPPRIRRLTRPAAQRGQARAGR